MEGESKQGGEGFSAALEALKGRGRALSGAEFEKLDQALNHVGSSPEILAAALEGREAEELDQSWRLVSLIVSAEDAARAIEHARALDRLLG